MSPCIVTANLLSGREDERFVWQKRGQKTRPSLFDLNSSEPYSCVPTRGASFNTGRWTKTEHERFLRGLRQFGKNWEVISGLLKTRSILQIRTHAQKYFRNVDRGLPFPEQVSARASSVSCWFSALVLG